jgi:hypothetical protein
MPISHRLGYLLRRLADDLQSADHREYGLFVRRKEEKSRPAVKLCAFSAAEAMSRR